MASTTPVCSVCYVHNITEPSVTWCKECDEGLCLKCQEHHSLSNGTLNHNTVPITEYEKLQRDNLHIAQNCNKHNEHYIIYCKKHESLCCGRCIVESHNECGNFAKLADIVKNIKTSNAFYEIEHSLVELGDSIKEIQQNRENNLTSLSERKRHILHEIKQTRERINKHLDEIQDDAINEINAAEEKENMNICHSLILLQEKGNEIAECQRNITKIKKLDTDLQTFIAMKELEIEVSNEVQFMQSMSKTADFKETNMSYQFNTGIQRFSSETQSLGELMIETKPCDIVFTRRKDKQAQMVLQQSSSRSVENINLKLDITLDNTGFCKWGCCMLPDGRFAFTETLNNLVRVFNTDGSKDFEVKTKYRAFDISYISEDNTLAVTSGKNGKCITIIDLQNKQIKKEIYTESYYHGLAVMDNKLICSADKKGIQCFNPNDNSISVIVGEEFPTMCYIATFDDKIYHTNNIINSVTCYDLQGTVKWTFEKESVLKRPFGISVDNDGKVYVVGRLSTNVVVISAGGQYHKEILTASNGLFHPLSLYYNRSTNQLLVANNNERAMLFSFI
ncbi:uncharacterized protein LOC127705021 isoform X1 [Mytilus californianus]|uniref:uncharacterized protein LOC127705021 isoform X1 n=1 Tax=Mytilus californianus TaxID=6549 RepID=UPI002246B0B1|nr:uncharacterized protein LOC127705021 isoform X1 [Mytilus californianus]XP_052065227.1 uncharacterized protein LOC127705021 isoform X1 [Mytilus californianus]